MRKPTAAAFSSSIGLYPLVFVACRLLLHWQRAWSAHKHMASHISEEETQQLLRTVEMFEAITESQPTDYQSLEILKEAYTKLGRQPDSLRISRKLADAY